MKQYLIFMLSGQLYAVETTYVVEVAGEKDIVHLPHLPKEVKGIMRLRERLIPIIDTKVKWGETDQLETLEKGYLIIMKREDQEMGYLVDEVLETCMWEDAAFQRIEGIEYFKEPLWIERFFLREKEMIGIVSQSVL